MKKIVLLIVCTLLVPSLGFAATGNLADGTSLGNSTTSVSLSPNVVLDYDSTGANHENYALTGASEKGAMCYGVESGNQGVYQMVVTPGANNLTAAADDDAPGTDQYAASSDWSSVGG